jgi:hypothetical protein
VIPSPSAQAARRANNKTSATTAVARRCIPTPIESPPHQDLPLITLQTDYKREPHSLSAHLAIKHTKPVLISINWLPPFERIPLNGYSRIKTGSPDTCDVKKADKSTTEEYLSVFYGNIGMRLMIIIHQFVILLILTILKKPETC